MKLQTHLDRDTVVVVLGQAPMLSMYFGSLKDRGIAVEFPEQIDERLIGIVRSHRRTVVVVGGGIDSGTKELTILSQLQHAGAILLSADANVERLGAVALAPVLPWHDVAWFPVEASRRFRLSAGGRTRVARLLMYKVNDRDWLARALLIAPCTIEEGAASFGLSRQGLIRRAHRHGLAWHRLCDGLVVEASKANTVSGACKLGALAEELGCSSGAELSRRLKRIGDFRWPDVAGDK